MRQRDPLTIHNERLKLLAGYANALSLGIVGFALLRPLVEQTAVLDTMLSVWVGAGLALHAMAHYILGYLKRETFDDGV